MSNLASRSSPTRRCFRGQAWPRPVAPAADPIGPERSQIRGRILSPAPETAAIDAQHGITYMGRMRRKRLPRWVGVRVSEADWAWLGVEADRRDLSVAELIRDLLSQARVAVAGDRPS